MTVLDTQRNPGVTELFTTVTDYGCGHLITEHFTSRDARRESLLERTAQFFTAREHIPELALSNDQHLAAMLSSFLIPAKVHLTEATFDPTTGVYTPSGRMLPVI